MSIVTKCWMTMMLIHCHGKVTDRLQSYIRNYIYIYNIYIYIYMIYTIDELRSA